MKLSLPLLALSAGLLCAIPLQARAELVLVPLQGFQEVPSVSTPARGWFAAVINRNTETVYYTLIYRDLQGEVRQAHIHLGERHTNGGVSVFLCQTASNPDPTGLSPACPMSPGQFNGTLTAANIVGPAGQGIAAGEFDELADAIRAGATYINVHTDLFPAGEIRGQTGR